MIDHEKQTPIDWLKSKLGRKQPTSEATFTIPQTNFEELIRMVGDAELEHKLEPIVDSVINKLKEKLPWIKKYALTTERIDLVKSRTVHIPRGMLASFVQEFFKGLGVKNLENTHLNEKSVNAGIYIGFGDFIALSVDPEEEKDDQEGPFLTTAEEILHFLRPFNPDEIKKIEGKMVNHLNEGATLYYLHQAYPDFDFFEKIKNPTNRGEAGHLRYLIYNVWKTWVEQHGEERMAASYFGRRKFPREVAKAIANGLIKEMFAATAKMLN